MAFFFALSGGVGWILDFFFALSDGVGWILAFRALFFGTSETGAGRLRRRERGEGDSGEGGSPGGDGTRRPSE